MFRFNLKSILSGLVIASAVAALPGCSTHSQEQPIPAAAQPTAVRLTTYPEKPDTRTDAEKAYDGFWSNSFCPMIHVFMSSSGVTWDVQWSPTGQATVINEDLGGYLTKGRTEYDEDIRAGEFPPNVPRDFAVAMDKKCPLTIGN